MSACTAKIVLDLRDPLLDLKLAVWQTQLEEVYPGATISCSFDQVTLRASVEIEFANSDEQLHWQMSWSNPAEQANSWLTYGYGVLSCTHEQQNNHLLQH